MNEDRLREYEAARKAYMRTHPEPIIDNLLKAKTERDIVMVAERNMIGRAELGYKPRQEDIDYIALHRLAAICYQQEADCLNAAEYADWIDYVDSINSAIGALRSV